VDTVVEFAAIAAISARDLAGLAVLLAQAPHLLSHFLRLVQVWCLGAISQLFCVLG
jgi:hypothetical protein